MDCGDLLCDMVSQALRFQYLDAIQMIICQDMHNGRLIHCFAGFMPVKTKSPQ